MFKMDCAKLMSLEHGGNVNVSQESHHGEGPMAPSFNYEQSS
jgi:hypothetical protein